MEPLIRLKYRLMVFFSKFQLIEIIELQLIMF